MPSGHRYKEPRICECGYSTCNPGNWSTHKKSCKLIQAEQFVVERERIASLEKDKNDLKEQLSVKDEQLAAKDRQLAEQAEEIKMLIKRPRTVNNTTNNRYVVEQHINVFGQESLEHITPEQIQMLLADPESAVARLVKLKHRKEPRNANVRCPNVNRAIYQVVVREGEEKEWENRTKGEVLEKLYDDNSCMLEAEADEEEHTSFLSHQDKVKASAAANSADGGRCYKEQLDKIHHMIVQ
jgi:hypothetical protein